MKKTIRRSAAAAGELLSAMRTALPALLGLVAVVPLLLVVPVAPGAITVLRALANVERDRVGQLLGKRIPAPYRPIEGGHWTRVRTVLVDPATWRDVLWLVAHGPFGGLIGTVVLAMWPQALVSLTIPLWWWMLAPGAQSALLIDVRTWPQALTLPFAQAAVSAVLAVFLTPLVARAQVRLALLLRPTASALLTLRVEELTETRTGVLHAHGAELRRIERDLHDGVQAQLVAVSVRLGLAERAFAAEPDTALTHLRDARGTIEDSLTQLRAVIRGIFPPILADRGLDGAVRTLAGGQPVPVTVRLPDDLPRLPAPVEAAAYFIIAESLTNIAKYADAGNVEVTVEPLEADLRVLVRDDGKGGADAAFGTGLDGIRRRVAALDGTVRIHSPLGEGTTIEVRLPCAS